MAIRTTAAVIDRELPMSEAAQAHRVMADSEHVGKILLHPKLTPCSSPAGEGTD